MKLKAQTLKDLNITWYMSKKPYERHTDYDVFYLNICRNVYEIITKAIKPFFTPDTMLDRHELMALAYAATAYFEDKAGNLGFWNACSDLMQETLGKRVPFYNDAALRSCDMEDVNKPELHVVLFLTMLNVLRGSPDNEITLAFGDAGVIAITNAVLDYFDTIDEIAETDFYKEWLDVRELDYFALKNRVLWLAQHGYMFAGYLSGRVSDDIDAMLSHVGPKNTDPAAIRAATYLQMDRRSFDSPSNLFAISPVDVLARVCTASDEQRQEIRDLRLRPTGNFDVEQVDEFYHFTHTITSDVFQIDITDLNGPLPLHESKLYNATLAKWGGTWHQSGMCVTTTVAEAAASDRTNQRNHCMYRPEYRAKIEELGRMHHAHELEFYGNVLTEYKSAAALEERMNEYYRWVLKRMTVNRDNAAVNPAPVTVNLRDAFAPGTAVALFLPPGDNGEIIAGHDELVRLLSPELAALLTREDVDVISEMLADTSLSAAYWRYLRSQYDLQILGRLLVTSLKDDADFEALLRLYHPEDFSARKLPEFSVVNGSWDEMIRPLDPPGSDT